MSCFLDSIYKIRLGHNLSQNEVQLENVKNQVQIDRGLVEPSLVTSCCLHIVCQCYHLKRLFYPFILSHSFRTFLPYNIEEDSNWEYTRLYSSDIEISQQKEIQYFSV